MGDVPVLPIQMQRPKRPDGDLRLNAVGCVLCGIRKQHTGCFLRPQHFDQPVLRRHMRLREKHPFHRSMMQKFPRHFR